MKKHIAPSVAAAAVIAGALFSGAITAAQAGELTRAQVRAELAQLRAAGYNQSVGEDVHYPDALQRAQARVAASDQVALASDSTGYGGIAASTSASSHNRFAPHLENDGMKPIYFGQ
jgi:uncharacterized protein DUF4148